MITFQPQHLTESDLLQHVEDDIKVNAIRDGRLVEVSWNDLTPEERRAANAVMFDLRGEEDWG